MVDVAQAPGTPPAPPARVVDADSHILEPADLWTARIASKHADAVPHVALNPDTGHHHWRIGEHWLWPVGHWAQAGWNQYPPMNPWEFDDVDPATFDAHHRLARLDEYGIDAQVLYPNIIGFEAPLIIALGPELALQCTIAYNDWLLEWASADLARLVPIAMLPFWDRDASVREMRRCVDLGHRGVLFANKFERINLPGFTDPYWDPIYATAQELDVPVNYHIGFAWPDLAENLREGTLAQRRADAGPTRRLKAMASASALMAGCDVLGELLTSDLCDRFPDVSFMSVESGFGQIPFYLEALDWHWLANGAEKRALLPSEYFTRQCYGTLWFESTTLALLERYPDNFMFSTDFPHPTSLSPGPCSPARVPQQHIADAYANLPPLVRANVLGGNARRIYKLGD